jgi:NitT/TauT family transport system substrate-binding protein/putative hydroxymethylpyrimidine transport system substrate-binding protein
MATSLVVFLAIVALGGCGSSGARSVSGGGVGGATRLAHRTKVTLILDFTPNAVHAGIYRAIAEGWYAQENIDLQVIEPSATSDTLALIDAHKADFGLADGSDVATEIDRGGDAQAVMAIAQRPLGGLIGRASEHLASPAQLQGRTVGITGVPSDKAVLDTEVADAGGDPAKVHVATVGFNGAQALRAGRIAAFTGFWPADGVQLEVSGEPITAFKLDRYGGPPYPGLVAFTTRSTIEAKPALVAAFVAATVKGYDATLATPSTSLNDLLRANPSLSRRLERASLRAYVPLFSAPGVPLGTIRPAAISALSAWMVSNKLIRAPISFTKYATDRFVR